MVNRFSICPACGCMQFTDLQKRIVEALDRQDEGWGLSGSQLAKMLGVTGSAVTKATEPLVTYDVLKKEPALVSKNIKLYVINEDARFSVKESLKH